MTQLHIFPELNLSVESYNFKPSLQEDLLGAALVISHAGAGTCLETLEARKPLIVVVNETLMNNHQTELAGKLASDGHCAYCASPQELSQVIANFEPEDLRPFPPGNKKDFAVCMDEIVADLL